MLALRPICEHCGKSLPPESTDAMICTFECTFCRACVENIIHNVCPTCGGGFSPRPNRPRTNWNGGFFLGNYPASQIKKHRPVNSDAHNKFAAKIKSIPPEAR